MSFFLQLLKTNVNFVIVNSLDLLVIQSGFYTNEMSHSVGPLVSRNPPGPHLKVNSHGPRAHFLL